MAETRTIRSLGVEAPGRAYIFSYEEGPPPPDHFRLATLYTGISAGTELTFFRGVNPYLQATWDAEFGLFRPGEPSIHYPMPFLGYMEVGIVTESRAAAVADGQIVAMVYGHKTGHTANALHEFYMPLPAELDPILGVLVAQMGPICANGLLHAAADQVGRSVRDLGDGVRGRNVVVMGGGVVGLLTALFARHWGAAETVLVSSTGPRLTAAAALGLTCLAADEVEPWRFCKERWHHGPQDRGADLVFQCKADAAALHEALRSLRPLGTVIDMAFYQGGALDLRLGEEFHHNGLTIRCAQINNMPLGLNHTWTRRRLAAETIDLLKVYGPQLRQHMFTHVIPFDQAPDFLAGLAATYQPEVIQAVVEVPSHRDLLGRLAQRLPQGQTNGATAHQATPT
jgi:NADPH:quinone reductase-like Zn-dependent oxidoreductase